MTHICVNNLTITGSDNGLSPGWRQAIIWTNAWILLARPLGTNFSEFLIKILTFSFKKKMRLRSGVHFVSASMLNRLSITHNTIITFKAFPWTFIWCRTFADTPYILLDWSLPEKIFAYMCKLIGTCCDTLLTTIASRAIVTNELI